MREPYNLANVRSLQAAMHLKPWQLQVQHFLLPKEDSIESECEDAIGINLDSKQFAIADGATEGFDSRRWAQLLAEHWVQMETPALTVEEFRSWVAAQGRLLHASWRERSFPWYAEEKARSGSFAAFVGLQFCASGGRLRWHTIALGDCCLVRRRRESAGCESLPISSPQGFNSCPLLVPSIVQDNVFSHAVVDSGAVDGGDVYLLLSDAVAAWYLQLFAERSPKVAEFESLLASSQHGNLVRLFQEERLARKIRDDDVAIVRISVERD